MFSVNLLVSVFDNRIQGTEFNTIGVWICKSFLHAKRSYPSVPHVQVKERSTNQGKLAVESLDLAQEVCSRTVGRDSRQAHHIGRLLAREHIELGDHETALRLLLPIAGRNTS